jgi:hypothetical protein
MIGQIETEKDRIDPKKIEKGRIECGKRIETYRIEFGIEMPIAEDPTGIGTGRTEKGRIEAVRDKV